MDWWHKKANADSNLDFEHIVMMDEGDPVAPKIAAEMERKYFKRPVRCVIAPHVSNNDAWNHAYKVSDPTSQIIIQVSDDFEPPNDWNAVVAGRLHSAGGWDKQLVLGVADPHFTPPYSGDGSCFTIYIATRAYIERCGHYLHPEYLSMLSDDDLAMKSCLDGVLVDGFDVMFFHHWHGADSDPKRDDTYSRHHTQRCWDQGHQVYAERFCALFPDIRTDADPGRSLGDNSKEFLVPPHLARQEVIDSMVAARRYRNTTHVQNKPPTDELRKAWFAGDLKLCRSILVEKVLKPYHMRACYGRFMCHVGVYVWNECCGILKDAELLGPHREEWRQLLGNTSWLPVNP